MHRFFSHKNIKPSCILNLHWLLFFFCITRLLYFSTTSLWLDELTTVWVIEDNLKQVFLRSFYYQGQSFLYYLTTWLSYNLLGENELWLRLPSYISICISLILLYQIAKKRLSSQSALIAITLLACNPEFIATATTARPYAMAVTFLLVGLTYTCRWISKPNNINLAGISLSIVAIFYLHYLLLPAVSLYFLLVAIGKNDKPSLPLKPLIVCIALTIALCLPALPHLLLLSSKTNLYQFAPKPTFLALVRAILCPELVLSLSIGAILILASRSPSGTSRCKYDLLQIARNDHFGLVLLFWTTAPAIILYCSWLAFGVNNFLDRYQIWQKPGLALVAALIAQALPKAWLRLLYCLSLVIFCNLGQRDWEEDWRGSSIFVSESQHCHVLLYSGLIESKSISWLNDHQTYFTTPYRYYDSRGTNEITPLPIFVSNNQQRTYTEHVIRDALNKSTHVCLIARDIGVDGIRSIDMFQKHLSDGGHLLREKLFQGVILQIWESK